MKNDDNMVRIALYEGYEKMSALIRWQTRSKYSHASLVLPNGTVIESTSKTGVVYNTSPDLTKATLFYVRGLTAEQSESVVNIARTYIGCGYDFLAILRFLSRRRMSTNSVWFCSELVYECFHRSGLHLLHPSVESWRVSPGLLSVSPMLVEDDSAWARDLCRRPIGKAAMMKEFTRYEMA